MTVRKTRSRVKSANNVVVIIIIAEMRGRREKFNLLDNCNTNVLFFFDNRKINVACLIEVTYL